MDRDLPGRFGSDGKPRAMLLVSSLLLLTLICLQSSLCR